MPSNVYILQLRDRPHVKIGKANDVLSRARQLGIEGLSLSDSLCLEFESEHDAHRVESLLHKAFHSWAIPAEKMRADGHSAGSTEWFDSRCLPRVRSFIEANRDLLGFRVVDTDSLLSDLTKATEPRPVRTRLAPSRPHIAPDLSAAAQASYASVFVAARRAEEQRSVRNLRGGFAKKLISNQIYWYYQYKSPDGKPMQIYVGPENEETLAVVRSHADPQTRAAQTHLKRLALATVALGCPTIVSKHATVLRRLSEHGFFRVGGVLIGTHAFVSYQSMLGTLWPADRSQDMNLARSGRNLHLALPKDASLNATSAIETLSKGFVPTASQTAFIASRSDFHLAFVTTDAVSNEPHFAASFNITLQPLRFMDYLMSDTTVVAVISPSGPIVVNVPRPERYAVHKLIIHDERPVAMRTKSNKDIEQAASLIDYLLDNDQDSLESAWNDAVGRGPGWKKRAVAGALKAAERYPHLAPGIEKLLAGSANTPPVPRG